jgi:VWFA-related protein
MYPQKTNPLTLAALVVVLITTVLNVRAQKPDEDDVVRVDTDVTSLLFTATDKQRRFITTLRQQDIRILEDGVPQTLFTFQQETDRPLSIALLIDVSASEERTLPDEKAAARSFIETIIQSKKDQAAIIPFTGSAFLEQPLTRDVLSIFRALERVDVAKPAYLGSGRVIEGIASGPGMKATPPEGSTAIWDALAITSTEVLAKSEGERRRAIIILTDGQDTSSRLASSEAVDRAIATETVIYAIGIGDSKQGGVDRNALKSIAERTGGYAFFPKKDVDLKTAFTEIEKELRTQYLIAYSSTNKNYNGAFRRLKVEITNPELKELTLRHRPGYFAKQRR